MSYGRRGMRRLFLLCTVFGLALECVAAEESRSALAPASASEQTLRVHAVGDGLIRFLSDVASDRDADGRRLRAGQVAAMLSASVRAHPEFVSASAGLEYSREVSREAFAAYLPQVYGSSSGGSRTLGDARTSGALLGFGVSQLLFDFGATSARVDAAEGRARAAQAGQTAKRSVLTYRAVSAWHELYRARQQIELHRLNVGSRREIAEFVRERADLGGSAFSDVLRAKARQTDAEAGLAAAENRVRAAEAAWLEAFGSPPPELVEIFPDVPVDANDYRRIEVLAQRFATVAQANALRDASQRDAESAQAARLPRFSLELAASNNNLIGNGQSLTDRSALVMLRYNFYTGGAESARIDQARAKARQAASDAENESRQVEKALQQALAEVETGGQTLKARRMAASVAAESLAAVREQFAFRRGTLLDLLRAQEDLFFTGRDMIDAMTDNALGRYRLLYLASELEERLLPPAKP